MATNHAPGSFEEYLAYLSGEQATYSPDPFRVTAAKQNREQFPNGCQLCGEQAGAEMGEFWLDEEKHEVTVHYHRDDDPETTLVEHSVIAHAQCGIDAGLEMA